jgi:hypothetical protein
MDTMAETTVSRPRNRHSLARYLTAGVLVTALCLTVGCGSQTPTAGHEGESFADRGWVTNCTGPLFSRAIRNDSAGHEIILPIFKINDQLVVVVPTENKPVANSIGSEPTKCRNISDLPNIHYLAFVIVGEWSAGYKTEDIQTVNGVKQFQPDVVGVRIEREAPNGRSIEEERKWENDRANVWRSQSTGVRQFGDLSCFVPTPAAIYFNCTGRRSKTDPDVVALRFRADIPGTRFKLVQANYPSFRYAGIRVYWQAWILDPSRALDVDAAVWNAIEEWNLLDTPSRSGRASLSKGTVQ